ncbi:DUF3147 family protein [Candidatus Gracilibacteria bacterium]|nr:DUF3147 family protein [Candidatus Gracilibacteria bacterium]
MNRETLFIIQLVTSFVVGGVFIAFLSFIAEKASEKTAGIIISLPATIALSFFFIGWTLSPEKVAEVAPIVPIMEGVIMLFTITYLSLSRIKLNKIPSIILCTLGGLFVWFVLAIPLALIELSNISISIIGYVILTTIAYYFITVKVHQKSIYVPLKYSILQKIFRATFAGFIIALSVFLAKTLGPFWGGVFSSFPAVYLSTFIIVHWHYDSFFLFKVWKNSPLGSIIFVIYPLTAIYTFPAFGIWGGTIFSYAICLIAFLFLIKIQKKLNK